MRTFLSQDPSSIQVSEKSVKYFFMWPCWQTNQPTNQHWLKHNLIGKSENHVFQADMKVPKQKMWG